MAALSRKKQVQDETLIDLSQAKVTAEHFLDRYRNILLGAVGAIVLIGGGYLVYRYVIVEPRQKEAVEQMFQAQMMFERDSFDLALNNPGGGYSGFLEIIDNFGGTPAANSAKYYAGVCYLNMGNFEDAVKYLEDFDAPDGMFEALKQGAIGDAYAEQDQMDKALAQYEKASKADDNDLTTPYYLLKLGQLSEKQGKKDEAKKAYETIKNEFPNTEEGAEVEKYLARLEQM